MGLKVLLVVVLASFITIVGGKNIAYAYLQQSSVQCWPPGSTKTVNGRTYRCECTTVGGVYWCFWVGLPSPNDDKATKRVYYNNSTYGNLAIHMESISGSIDQFSMNAVIATPSGDEDIEPAGSFRVLMNVQKYENSTWVNKMSTGYVYNTVSSSSMHYVFNMGTVPDWGEGAYRVYSSSQKYDGGSWIGISGNTGSVYMYD